MGLKGYYPEASLSFCFDEISLALLLRLKVVSLKTPN